MMPGEGTVRREARRAAVEDPAVLSVRAPQPVLDLEGRAFPNAFLRAATRGPRSSGWTSAAQSTPPAPSVAPRPVNASQLWLNQSGCSSVSASQTMSGVASAIVRKRPSLSESASRTRWASVALRARSDSIDCSSAFSRSRSASSLRRRRRVASSARVTASTPMATKTKSSRRVTLPGDARSPPNR